MRYRKLSPSGDYTFGNGQLDFYKDVPEAPAQAVQTRLNLWVGEWFLDTEEGTAYMQGVLGKYSQKSADVTIQQRVLGTQGVNDLSNFESTLDPDSRKYPATMDLDTIYGPTEVDIENYINY